ncbi:GH92 family glycosyl hydrolase [Herbiconiux sp. P17]|uniref:GH92 family glycosyl hydrolase n=1 Tax=Herbiconiux wuyangfengii TaxID=3342794 RepID=UPI0035B7F3FA
MIRSTVIGAGVSLALLATTALGTATAAPALAAPQDPDPGAVDYTQYVDPFIGTGDATTLTGHPPGSGLVGQGTPAAHLPFGMLQWGPGTDSVNNNSRHYNYADSKITGFSLHNEFGYEPQMVSFLPVSGDVTASPGSNLSNYYQSFSHENETAGAGTYSVDLDSGVSADLTATTRAGIAEFGYPDGATTSLIVNLQDPTGNTNGNNAITIDPATGIVSGSVGHVSNQNAKGSSSLYFSASFDRPIVNYSIFNGGTLSPSGTSTTGGAIGAVLTFAGSADPLVTRTGVSWVSSANAEANLDAEIPSGTGYDAVSTAAHDSWQQLLSRFAVTDLNAEAADLRNFYSALYRTVSAPTTYSDVNGEYQGWDGQTHTVEAGRTEYNGWGSWNGARTGQMAFLATFFPSVANDVGQSIVDSALLDNFNHNVSQGNGFFDGDSGDFAQLPELYAFGATDFDAETGLNMLLQSANQATNNVVRYGNDKYLTNGYVPADQGYPLPTELTQSYAQFDFNTAQMAAAIGEDSWAGQLMARSDNWRNVFDAAATSDVGTGYMWGRNADGSYAGNFCPECGDWTGGTRSDGTTFWEEGSSAQESYWPTYDLAALVRAQGGSDAFVSRLDDFFTKLNDGTHSSHYYQGNEPNVMAPWEYNWAGHPSGTQDTVRRIITSVFLDTPGGMPGNDDWSAESTWQTWAMLGIFPEIPAVGGFAVASPIFAKTVITLEDGNTFTITGDGASRATPFVQSATLDGESYDSPWLPLNEVVNGQDNELSFALGDTESDWGSAPTENAPPSFPAPTFGTVASTTGTAGSLYRDYDLGGVRSVTGFTATGALPGGYSIQSSVDGDPTGAWTTLATSDGATTPAEFFVDPTSTQYVRVLATDPASTGPVPTLEVRGVSVPADLASGKSSTTSGQSCSPSEGGSGALDGSDLSKWCINAGSSAAWLSVDLGSVQSIDRFALKSAGINGEGDHYNTRDYAIQVSETGDPAGTWTDVATIDGNTSRVRHTSIDAVDARYVRLYITKGVQDDGDNVARVYSFEVYGPDQATTPDLLGSKPATASGDACSVGDGPANALDGSDRTKWCMNAGGSPAWAIVDLGKAQTIDRFVVKNAGVGGESDNDNTVDFRVQTSETGDPNGTWNDVATVSGNTARVNTLAVAPVTTQFVRIYITKGTRASADNVVRVYGFEAHGTFVAPAPQTGPVDPGGPTEPTKPVVDRIAGADRYEVSVNTSNAGFPDGAKTVYVASGEVFPDALSAAPAAAMVNGPILLTAAGSLPGVVKDEIARLDPDRIVIVGGKNSVGSAVEASLATIATVERIGGADRFEASRNIAAEAFPEGADVAVLATGGTFPDALSAGAAIGKNGPVILVNGTSSSLDAATKKLLGDLGVTSIVIAGGPNSVSAGIAADAAKIADTTRLGGADRYEASRSINAHFFTDADRVLLATGENFPDALSGSSFGPEIGAPLFTVHGDCVPAETLSQINALGASKVTLLGGERTLTKAVEELTACS